MMQTIAHARKTAGVKVLPEVLEYAEKRLLESLPDSTVLSECALACRSSRRRITYIRWHLRKSVERRLRAVLAHSSRHELRNEEKEIVDRVTDAYAETLVRIGKSEGVDLSKLLEHTPTTRDESIVYEKFFDAQCNSSS